MFPAVAAGAPDDDVWTEPRLRALRRWLGLAAPLAPAEAVALRILMRPAARVVRAGDCYGPRARQQLCPLCAEILTQGDPAREALDAGDASPHAQRSAWVVGGDVLWQLASFAMLWIVYVALAAVRWILAVRRRARRRRALGVTEAELRGVLASAPCYSSWHCAAGTLDELEGNARWKAPEARQDPLVSGLCQACATEWGSRKAQRRRNRAARETLEKVEAVCDFDMLSAKLHELAVLYKTGDLKGLAFALRASLLRNLGGLCHPELHAHSRVGTNQVVEDYVNVVSYLLAYIAHSEVQPRGSPLQLSVSGPPLNNDAGTNATSEIPTLRRTNRGAQTRSLQSSPEVHIRSSSNERLLTLDDKLTFLNEARHAYGRSALMLSGGASMGLNHLGVVKALLDQGLLPRVVCGTSAGAVVASIVGIFDDVELLSILSNDALINPITQQPFTFRYFDEHTTAFQRLRRFMRKGHIQDVKMLQDCLRKNFGDLTFKEAYNKTKRILNITVCPLRSSSDPPLLLNYLTAPHVLIWSAASASCALPLVFAPVELVTKNSNSRLMPYHPDGVRWIDGSISSDVPLARIGELFNVNHFIVSQTNPHVIPRSMPIMHTRLALLIKSELQFRYWQALQMGLVPKLLTSIFPHFMQPYAGDVTIMPDVRLSDLTRLLSNPTSESIQSFIRRGEVQTFPFLDRIRLHCLIEQTLDSAVEYVATAAKRDESGSYPSSPRRGSALFGRVPSWLWIDTRSIPGGGTMSAVAQRLGRRREEGTLDIGEEKPDTPSEGVENQMNSRKPRITGRKSRPGKLAAVDEMLDDILLELAGETETSPDEGRAEATEFEVQTLEEGSEDSTDDEKRMC